MGEFHILITDLTPYNTSFCVAGWDINRNVMIRPEPPAANAHNEKTKFWNAHFVGPGKPFQIGNLVQFEANDAPRDFTFPHATEDKIIADVQTIKICDHLTDTDMLMKVKGSISEDVRSAFDGNLKVQKYGKLFVDPGQKSPSLGAVELDSGTFQFVSSSYGDKPPKLRCRFKCNNEPYDLPVTAESCRISFQNQGVVELNKKAANCRKIHVRLGLSRAYGDPPRCYLQVNGVYFQA
jgi:hypothetical protein